MVLLGEDEHGVWVGLKSGGTVQRGHEPARRHPHDLLSVVTDGAWFIPIFSPADPRFGIYVDICTPPVWTADDRVESFDLDLDVAVAPDGTVSVLDEDEFDDHRVRYSYPDELVVGARAATEYVLAAIEAGHGPFDGTADDWFQLI
jgi:protein associated with RNAse G/E